MDRYIGMDVHAASCTIAVVGPSGRRLGSQVVETNGQALVAAIRAIPQPRHLCMEEGTQSAWLYEVLRARTCNGRAELRRAGVDITLHGTRSAKSFPGHAEQPTRAGLRA